jgi:hypothetical protein
MIWALLAILGIPIWLIVGALGGALLARRRFQAQSGVFRLKQRAAGQDKWPRRVVYGRMIHDVLVVNKGIALARTTFCGVRSVTDHGRDEPVAPFDEAVVFELTFDDGSRVLVAVDGTAARHIESLRGDAHGLRRKQEEQ